MSGKDKTSVCEFAIRVDKVFKCRLAIVLFCPYEDEDYTKCGIWQSQRR